MAAVYSKGRKFISVQGDAVNLAALLEARATEGTAWVHRSAIDQIEAHAVVTKGVKLKGKGEQQCAVFDLTHRVWRVSECCACRLARRLCEWLVVRYSVDGL